MSTNYIARFVATKALTSLLGKLGLQSCTMHREVRPAFGPSFRSVSYGVINLDIHDFNDRMSTTHKRR